MQAPPTPEYSDTSAAPSSSNMSRSGAKKRSLNNYLEDAQNVPTGREQLHNPYAETMPLNIIIPRGSHHAFFPDTIASRELVSLQNGDGAHVGGQQAIKAMQQEQEHSQSQDRVQRLRMEHEALTHCLIKTMNRDTLEHLLARAAFQYPSIMHSIIASNNPSSADAQPPQPSKEQNTISHERRTRELSKLSTDLASPDSGGFSKPQSLTLHTPDPASHIGQASKRQQTGDTEIVYDPHIHGSASNGWTVQDDQLLKESRDRGMTWPQIQVKYFPSKTHSQCRLRLARVFGLNAKEDRGPYTMIPWAPEEDVRLLAARKSGLSWHRLQQSHFPNRTHFACSHRYRKLLRDTVQENRMQSGTSSDDQAEEDLDETEAEEEVEPSTNNLSTSWSSADDELLINSRQSGMQFVDIQKKYFPNRAPHSVESHYRRLKRMEPTSMSRDPSGEEQYKKGPQKQESEKGDTALDELSSPPEEEVGNEPVEGRNKILPTLVASPKDLPTSPTTPATEPQSSHPSVPSTEKRKERIPLPAGPQRVKQHPETVEIEDKDEQGEKTEESKEVEDVIMADGDREQPDPDTTITVHIPSDYVP